MPLAASATAWSCHLGDGRPGLGAWSLSLPLPRRGRKEPRLACKLLEGPGLAPRIFAPTDSRISTAQGQGDESNSWSGFTERE